MITIEEFNELISSGKRKFGCLEILDAGEEYKEFVAKKISEIKEEKQSFIEAMQNKRLKRADWPGTDGTIPACIYKPANFMLPDYYESVRVVDFDEAIARLVTSNQKIHYKCICKKCGKICYYTAQTLCTNPSYCLRPIYCSERFTYSISARNSTYHKKMKYHYNESVHLVGNKDLIIPSDNYCVKWNEKREKEIKKQEEKESALFAALPRVLAQNYDVNFSGLTYESLEILDCINEHLESLPHAWFNQCHQKKYAPIIVYKQYRCKCYICGREQKITCDKFGIFPPTEYGYTAYEGYWSRVKCDCHIVSSFQWIVNKLLIEKKVMYRVELSFPDLYGVGGIRQLRFDFAIFNADGTIRALIECQGEQHFKPVEEFGGDEQYKKQVLNDNLKRKYAIEHNIPLIEIPYKDKKYEKIKEILEENDII